MDISTIYDYCLNKKGTTESFPFDEDTLTFKVGGKMYLLMSLSDWEKGEASMNLKCDPDHAEELRAEFIEIIPGYHMNKKHWNTVQIKGAITWPFLKELIDHSYDLVYGSLTKKVRESIG